MEAEIARSADAAEKAAAVQAHLDRIKDVHSEVLARAALGREDIGHYVAADYFVADARASAAIVQASLGMDFDSRSPKTARLAAARMLYDLDRRELQETQRTRAEPNAAFPLRGLNIYPVSAWSWRWCQAAMALAATENDRVSALKDYLERQQELEKIVKEERAADHVPEMVLLDAIYGRKRAEAMLMEVIAAKGDKALLDSRKALLDAAESARNAQWAWLLERHDSIEDAYRWSASLRDAAFALANSKAEKVAALESHLTRMSELRKLAKAWWNAATLSSIYEVWATEYYVAEAEIHLTEMR
jgi:hypothetical protein